MNYMICNKKIFIFGGSGSLGHAIIDRYLNENTIINFSRDESKHWKMNLKYRSNKLKFIIGDVRDYNRVESALLREQPDIVIIAAALKHIDRCEFSVNECVLTNFMGPKNILSAIEKNQHRLECLTSVAMIGTDKNVSPVNTYGCAKALALKMNIECSLYIKNIKFVNFVYGNILNSNGSIIQILNDIGNDPNAKNFMLTHENMTRYFMTLEQAVSLIEHGILFAESGDTVVPKLPAMKIKDLIELFAEKYNKPIMIGKLRPGEKLYESLINETQSMSMIEDDKYYYVKPPYKELCNPENAKDYNSTQNQLTKCELKKYLVDLNLL